MRKGRIPSQEGTRLAFVLQVIAKVLEQSDLERRIEQLERNVHATVQKNYPT
jgi:hypothetical protein